MHKGKLGRDYRDEIGAAELDEPDLDDEEYVDLPEQWELDEDNRIQPTEEAGDAQSDDPPESENVEEDSGGSMGVPVPVDSSTILLGLAALLILVIIVRAGSSGSDDQDDQDEEETTNQNQGPAGGVQGGPIHG